MNQEAREAAKWTMPEWMESYRDYFYSTGGNTVEELMNALSDPRLSKTNAVLFTIAMMAEAQVALLTRLHSDGKLTDTNSGYEACQKAPQQGERDDS